MYAINDETKTQNHGATDSFLAALVCASEAFAARLPELGDAPIPGHNEPRSPPR